MYSNMPLCITDFTAEIFTMSYGTCRAVYLGKLVAQSDMLPGWSLLTVLANLTYTYKNATIVSEVAVQHGMFVCVIQSVYSIDASEKLPEMGTKVTSGTHRWWKGYTPISIVRYLLAAQLDLYGVPFAGKMSIGMKSTSLLETGNKVATWNG